MKVIASLPLTAVFVFPSPWSGPESVSAGVMLNGQCSQGRDFSTDLETLKFQERMDDYFDGLGRFGKALEPPVNQFSDTTGGVVKLFHTVAGDGIDASDVFEVFRDDLDKQFEQINEYVGTKAFKLNLDNAKADLSRTLRNAYVSIYHYSEDARDGCIHLHDAAQAMENAKSVFEAWQADRIGYDLRHIFLPLLLKTAPLHLSIYQEMFYMEKESPFSCKESIEGLELFAEDAYEYYIDQFDELIPKWWIWRQGKLNSAQYTIVETVDDGAWISYKFEVTDELTGVQCSDVDYKVWYTHKDIEAICDEGEYHNMDQDCGFTVPCLKPTYVLKSVETTCGEKLHYTGWESAGKWARGTLAVTRGEILADMLQALDPVWSLHRFIPGREAETAEYPESTAAFPLNTYREGLWRGPYRPYNNGNNGFNIAGWETGEGNYPIHQGLPVIEQIGVNNEVNWINSWDSANQGLHLRVNTQDASRHKIDVPEGYWIYALQTGYHKNSMKEHGGFIASYQAFYTNGVDFKTSNKLAYGRNRVDDFVGVSMGQKWALTAMKTTGTAYDEVLYTEWKPAALLGIKESPIQHYYLRGSRLHA